MELTLALIADYINLKPFMYEQSIKPWLSLIFSPLLQECWLEFLRKNKKFDIFLADVLCHTAKAEHFLLSYLWIIFIALICNCWPNIISLMYWQLQKTTLNDFIHIEEQKNRQSFKIFFDEWQGSKSFFYFVEPQSNWLPSIDGVFQKVSEFLGQRNGLLDAILSWWIAYVYDRSLKIGFSSESLNLR